MCFLLYVGTAAGLLWIAHRALLPISIRAALALILFPMLFTGRALVTGGVLAPIDLSFDSQPMASIRAPFGVTPDHDPLLSDLYTQMLPYRQVLREHIRHGEWPLWDPSILGGEPLAAQAQPAAYFPFTLIALLLPVAVSFTYTAAIAFFIAALSLFLLAHDLGCGEMSALFGAAGWMYASALAFLVLWPLGMTWALLPFVLFAVRRIVIQPTRSSAVILTTAFVLILLAGHPETLLHIITIGGAYGIYELVRAPRGRRIRAMTLACLSGVVAILLCAVQLFPFVEALPQTGQYVYRRYLETQPFTATPRAEMGARLAADFLSAAEMRTWNEVAGTPFLPTAAGVGSIVLAAAIFGLWKSRHRDRGFIAAVLLFGLLSQLQWTPLARLFHALPPFSLTFNDRYAFAAACMLALLGAFGVEALMQGGDRRAFALTALAVLAVVAAGSAWLERTEFHPNVFAFGDYRLAADVILLGIAAIVVALRTPMRLVLPALVALVLVQRTIQEGALYPAYPAKSAYPPIPVLEKVRPSAEPFRIAGYGMAFVPGTSAMYGLEDARGYSAMTLRDLFITYPLWCVHQPAFFNRIDDVSKPFLSFLNVRYALMGIFDPKVPGWHDVASYRLSRMMENERVIGRAFVPNRVRFGWEEAQVLEQMGKETDFREHAWLYANLPRHERINGPGTVTTRRIKYGFDIDAVMENDGWIVVSEPAWKGWRAYVDGRRIEHQIANIAFLAIHVPKGSHRVRLIYMPRSFVTGRAVTMITIAALLVTYFAKGRKRTED